LTQFLAESILLAVIGRHRRRARRSSGNRRLQQLERLGRRDPPEAWTGGIASAILIGAVAGLMPARPSMTNAAHRRTANRVSPKDRPPSIATSTDRGTAPTPW
jgi:hypothetical protein